MNEQDVVDSGEQFVLTTTGLKVIVLSRARDIIVKITLDLPLENLSWEGCENRIFLHWADIRMFKWSTNAELEIGCSPLVFGREVLLPCEVDFSNAVWVLNANRLILRLPKYVPKLVQGPEVILIDILN